MFLIAMSIAFAMAFFFGTMLGIWFSDRMVSSQVKGLRELYQTENNWIVDRLRESNERIQDLERELAKLKGK